MRCLGVQPIPRDPMWRLTNLAHIAASQPSTPSPNRKSARVRTASPYRANYHQLISSLPSFIAVSPPCRPCRPLLHSVDRASIYSLYRSHMPLSARDSDTYFFLFARKIRYPVSSRFLHSSASTATLDKHMLLGVTDKKSNSRTCYLMCWCNQDLRAPQ